MGKHILIITCMLFYCGCRENTGPDPVNNAITSTLTAPSMAQTGQEIQVQYTLEDLDGLESLDFSVSLPGYSFTKQFNTETRFDTTLTIQTNTPQDVTYSALARAKTPDGLETQVRDAQTTYSQSLEQRSIEFCAAAGETPLAGLTAELYQDGQLQQTTTLDEQGNGQFSIQAIPQSTPSYELRIPGHGIVDFTDTILSDEQTEERTYAVTPVTPQITTEELEIRPRSTQTINPEDFANELVDPDTNEPISLEAVINGTSTNLAYTAGSLSVQNDAADSQEYVEATVQAPYASVSGQAPVYITQRAPITLTQNLFSVNEDGQVILTDFAQNYLSSEVDISSLTVVDTDANITVEKQGNNVEITPNTDYFGTANFNVQAENAEGFTLDQTVSVDVEKLPRATLRYEMNGPDADPSTEGLQMHLFVYQNGQEEEITSNNGNIEFKLRANEAVVHAHSDKQGDVYGWITNDTLRTNGEDITQLIRFENGSLYDIDKNKVDEMSQTEQGMVGDYEGFADWIIAKHMGGVTPFNLEGDAPRNGKFRWFAETAGRGPASIELPDTLNFINGHGKHGMNEPTRQVTYEYHPRWQKWTDNQLGDIVEVPYLEFESTNNQHRNKIIYSGFNSGGGTLRVYGTPENTVLSSISFTTSDFLGTPLDDIRRAHINETIGTIGTFSREDNDAYTLPEESVANDNSSLLYLTLYDGKFVRAVWEPTYTGFVKDKFGVPNYTTHRLEQE